MEIIQEHARVWKYWLSEERLVQTSVGMFQRDTFKIHTSVGANLRLPIRGVDRLNTEGGRNPASRLTQIAKFTIT